MKEKSWTLREREREMMVCWSFFFIRRAEEVDRLDVVSGYEAEFIVALWRRIFCGKMWFKFFKNNFGYSEF